MDHDKFALVEKILKDIDNIMLKNAELYAFDIVPVESNFQNKSPVLHMENCLGLESWCVKHVYMYCYSELMDKYLGKSKRKALKLSSVNSERLTKLLNVTLLLNPELSTLWNKRRDLVFRSDLHRIAELRFTKLVLSRKPKSNDAFSYRRWLLDSIFQEENLQSNFIDNLVNEELRICQLAADKSPNNYHSWSHRMWLLQKLKNIDKQYNLNLLYMKEYDFSEHWISKHVSDYSCFHYRQFCIKNIFAIETDSLWKDVNDYIHINLRNSFVHVLMANYPSDSTVNLVEKDLLSCTPDNLLNVLFINSYKNCNCNINNFLTCRKFEILFHELNSNNELLRFYKGHETLWYHRRFIVFQILNVMYEYFGLQKLNGILIKGNCKKCKSDCLVEKQAKLVRYDSNRIYLSNLFKILLNHEKKFIEEMKMNSDHYSERHEKYLKYVQGINN